MGMEENIFIKLTAVYNVPEVILLCSGKGTTWNSNLNWGYCLIEIVIIHTHILPIFNYWGDQSGKLSGDGDHHLCLL